MKSILIQISLFAISFAALNAQELISKRGEPFLPEAGDWAIQINAVPFLNYAGNLFSNAGNNTLFAQSPAGYPFSVGGKYFITENRAYRGRFMFNFNNETTNNLVTRDRQTAPIDPNITVTDTRRQRTNSVFLAGGMEFRKGKTRLQGLYGGEAVLMYNGGVNTDFLYSNPFASDNTNPNTTLNFNTGETAAVSSRVVSTRTGSAFGLGARAFLGAEYFLFPKVSIGLEYGWGLMLSTTGRGETAVQEWDTIESAVVRRTSRTAGGNSFGINGDISGGAINLILHF
jgi:hypothetical protein